nr:MAG TPA: hypothetical protein [Bacteriophage sp.]
MTIIRSNCSHNCDCHCDNYCDTPCFYGILQ